jgi:biopolymer transport protein ExbD
MRRFSKRNPLVTLNEINITPLLDIAFVLLLIFIITRPLLEQSMHLKLPEASPQPVRQVDQKNIRTVEISPAGEYRLGTRAMAIGQLEAELVRDFQQNPNLIVVVRGDADAKWQWINDVIDTCTRNGITQVSFQSTERQ